MESREQFQDRVVRLKGQSVISAKTMRENMPWIENPANEQINIRQEKATGMQYKFRAQINAPEGYEEGRDSYRWTPPFKDTNDLEAAKLWITQMLLENGSYERDQAVVFEVTYTRVDLDA